MDDEIKISIRIGNSVVDGMLYDNEAARAFAAMLPLTLTLSDYEDAEKCGELPDDLPVNENITGYDPVQGDIAYYAPCGCLSIFYRDDGYSSDLVGIGKVTGNLAPIHTSENMEVTFSIRANRSNL